MDVHRRASFRCRTGRSAGTYAAGSATGSADRVGSSLTLSGVTGRWRDRARTPGRRRGRDGGHQGHARGAVAGGAGRRAADGRRRGRREQPGQCDAPGHAPPHLGQSAARPAPRMLPVHTCVVDKGNARWDEARITAVALVSAAKPCGASMSVSPFPMVRMMRHPPVYVPSAIAIPEMSTTTRAARSHGRLRPGRDEGQSSMTPMVFCASLVPWASATSDAEADLPPTESPPRLVGRRPPGDDVREVGRQQGHDTGDERRDDGRGSGSSR